MRDKLLEHYPTRVTCCLHHRFVAFLINKINSLNGYFTIIGIIDEKHYFFLKMDIVSSFRTYLDSILSGIDGMKILIFDEETSEIISLVYTQTELLRHDVILVDSLTKLGKKKIDEALISIQSIFILRPDEDNIRKLCSELNTPHYGNYYLFFTNSIGSKNIQNLAYSDHSSKVVAVHEIFFDVYALNKRLFSLNIPSFYRNLSPTNDSRVQRVIDGLFSVICSLKVNVQIRYDSSSSICRRIAEVLTEHIRSYSKPFHTSETAVLLLIDRRSDSLTPLLHWWDYQSMIHENLDFKNNIAKIDSKNQVVVDERTDPFFAKHLYSFISDLSAAINQLVTSVNQQPNPKDITDIESLKSYIQNYPMLQERRQITDKHTQLSSACTKSIKEEGLTKVSVLEQSIASEDDPNSQFQALMEILNAPTTSDQIALRLSLIFCLRYEENIEKVSEIFRHISSRKDGEKLNQVIEKFLSFCGKSYKKSGLFGVHKAVNAVKSMFSGFLNKGDDSQAFMQYHPLLESVLDKLRAGKLENGLYPAFPDSQLVIPQKTIVFFVGGITYTEGKIVYEASSNGMDVIIGGTTVHNMNSFVMSEIPN